MEQKEQKYKLIRIGRPINGISLNGLEYLTDGGRNVRLFTSIEIAKAFIRKYDNPDYTDEELEDNFIFKRSFLMSKKDFLNFCFLDISPDKAMDWIKMFHNTLKQEEEVNIQSIINHTKKYPGYLFKNQFTEKEIKAGRNLEDIDLDDIFVVNSPIQHIEEILEKQKIMNLKTE